MIGRAVARAEDNEHRRRQIIEALRRITVRGGLGSATFREVAAEAEVSVGMVQHHFGTKEELLLATLHDLIARVSNRIFSRIAELGEAASPRAIVEAAVDEFLPIDEERHESALLFIAFHTASLTDSSLASAEGMDFPRVLSSSLADELRRADRAGSLAPGIDPEREALGVMTMIIGLGHMVPAGTYSHEEAKALVAYTVDRMFSD